LCIAECILYAELQSRFWHCRQTSWSIWALHHFLAKMFMFLKQKANINIQFQSHTEGSTGCILTYVLTDFLKLTVDKDLKITSVTTITANHRSEGTSQDQRRHRRQCKHRNIWFMHKKKSCMDILHLGWHSKKPPCCSKDPPKFSSNQREISSQLFTPATNGSLMYRIQLCSDLIKMKECWCFTHRCSRSWRLVISTDWSCVVEELTPPHDASHRESTV
jgi:hypothetical protein